MDDKFKIVDGKKDSNVKPINTVSEHDVRIDGKHYRLNIDVQYNLTLVEYWILVKRKTPFGEHEGADTVVGERVRLKWYDKFIGRNMDSKIALAIENLKKEIHNIHKLIKREKELKAKFGIKYGEDE